jgi:hypothetical protein
MIDDIENEAESLIAAAIDAAENISEPLEGVAEKVMADPADDSSEDCCAGGGRRPNQADILISLAPADLFHDQDDTGYADLDVNGHRETWPLRSKGFKQWLSRRYFEATGGAPNNEAYQSALNVIEAKARFDGQERSVHIRVGGLDGRLYLDLADENWRAVEIDSTGWPQ